MSTYERHNDWNMASAPWDYECSTFHQTKAMLPEGDTSFPGPNDYLSLEHPPFSISDQTHYPAIHSPTFQSEVQPYSSPQAFQHLPSGNTAFWAVESRDCAPETEIDSTSFPVASILSTQQWVYNNLVWDTDLEPSPTRSTPASSISPSPQSNTQLASASGEALPKPTRTRSESMVSRRSRQSWQEESNERKQNAQQLHSKVEQSYRNRLNDTIEALAKQLFDAQGQSRETMKPSKWLVITHARERLEQVETRNKELKRELEGIKEENAVLKYLLEKDREDVS